MSDLKSWHQEIDELLRIKKWSTMFFKTTRTDQGHDDGWEAPTDEVFKWTYHREFAKLLPKVLDSLLLDNIPDKECLGPKRWHDCHVIQIKLILESHQIVCHLVRLSIILKWLFLYLFHAFWGVNESDFGWERLRGRRLRRLLRLTALWTCRNWRLSVWGARRFF